ncbi:MAG: DUF3810 domain-containing protein [Gemmatimonadetes bacterium]|nr:DUF3810 domain-containing protein [Gemmatimonadota bacterium]
MEQAETHTAVRTAPDTSDWPLYARQRLLVLAVGVAAFLVFQLLSLVPGLVEAIYARSLSPMIVRPLSFVTGLLPFSLVEVVVIAYVVWMLVLLGRTVTLVVRKQRRLRNAVLGGSLRMARDAGVMMVLFYFLWGFNYARRPLEERLEWPEWSAPDTDELERLAVTAVEAANRAYFEIHQSEDAGVPTAMLRDVGELDRALEEGWSRAGELLHLPASMRRRYGPTKRLIFSHLVARFGIAGFYFPWTAEANVLGDSPAVSRSQSMAHEKAHQRGIGPESEASFLGFVAGALAPHPHARYSALVFAQGQLLRVLARADREAAQEVVANRFPGIRRDLDDLSEYWEQFQGVGTTIGRALNDRYLRTNRVRAGVRSYGLSVRLLITFAGQNNGSVLP